MAVNKQRSEETHVGNGIAKDTSFMNKAKKMTDRFSPETQGYIALAIGAFLLMFSLGYFAFVKMAIGFIGIALIAFGALKSHLISNVIDWVQKLIKRF